MKRSILLIEDDVLMREFISDYFIQEEWEVQEAENGRIALDKFNAAHFDLIILDIMMPEMDGYTVCRSIRAKSDIPIIIITARSDDEDQLLGFELGADEYVIKPLSPRVLVARAKALLKRKEGTVGRKNEMLVYGELQINRKAHVVNISGVNIDFSPKEYDLLLFLVQNYGKVLSREYILNAVWGYDYLGDLRTVDTHIKKLRAKLGETGRYIVTVVRAGYKFEV
ncbi:MULTISPECIES: response regulator transcription factor [Paenibacillus]|uniref:Two component transcriptional regulator, winged helix family n=3 Tax=Paenibacillus TaxID=44249 RepID=G4HJX1_9BACL|nr:MULTISPECIES: response regulator transcription factor [Paenibacillus]EHB62575.1 two component transcriptional regulator, winged helix family [Paenibacillus lactis 154]MBP1896827.1 DNA-binding response OmpR family regulator [Paenibacillus lactis]OOC61558.1 DNA-binding response regulator [Paenibacillus ihbetae]GIO90372.1 DNA-binding response regulator [Paenibacillus lactis]